MYTQRYVKVQQWHTTLYVTLHMDWFNLVIECEIATGGHIWLEKHGNGAGIKW